MILVWSEKLAQPCIMGMGDKPLVGRTILLVEDNLLLAECMRDLLEDAGAIVVEPGEYDKLSNAIAGGTIDLDGAVLDAALDRQSSASIAHKLKERSVPFVVLSGYDRGVLPGELKRAPYLAKPVEPSRLVDLAARLFRALPQDQRGK